MVLARDKEVTGRTRTPAADQSAGLIDPNTLMRIRSLQIRAKVVVEGFFSGLHRSPYHGFSAEFSEYRQYSPGDDLRYLDWRLFARSDRYYIKRFEDETNLRCHLLVDLSRSMGYGSGKYTKVEYARTMAATLAYFLSSQRDSVGVMTFDERVEDYIPARYRPGHMHRIMVCLQRAVGGRATDLATPIDQLARVAAKRGLIVLISDLMAPLETLERDLAFLRCRGHEVVLLRVLDPAEVDFSFEQPAMFHDLESGRRLYVDPEAIREDYLRQFREHAESITSICGNLGIDFYQFTIDRALELSLFDFITSRMRRGRRTLRRGLRTLGGHETRSRGAT